MIPIYLDVETGGLDPLINPLLQVGIIIEDDSLELTIKPKSDLSDCTPEALEINGLTLETLQSGVSLKEANLMILNFFKKHKVTSKTHYFVGVNINFDISFIKTNFELSDLPYRNIDISTLGLLVLGRGGSDVMAESLGIPIEIKPHTALNGAKQNKKLLEAFKKRLNL